MSNTLARISDNYWLVRDDFANVVGIVARHSDSYTGFLNGQNPEVLANLDAVVDFVNSDTEHVIDTRLTPDMVTRLAIHAANL